MSDDILTRLRRGYAFLRDQGHFITANACLAAIHEIQNLRAPTDGAEANGWRSLSTAPRDGTAVIVLLPERFYPRVVEARWRHDLNYPWWDTRTHHLEWEDVLAWMPFPPAPARSNPPSRGESDAR